MNLDQETKDKIDKLPLIFKTAVNYLLEMADNIINGNCSEDAVTSTIGTLNNNASKRYGKHDLLTYEKASDILGFGRNMVGLKALLDKHGIKQQVINNQKCGFLRSEVMALNDKLLEERKAKEYKRKSKEEKEIARIKQKEELQRLREEVKRRKFL